MIAYGTASTCLKFFFYYQLPESSNETEKESLPIGFKAFLNEDGPGEKTLICFRLISCVFTVIEVGLYLWALAAVMLNDGSLNYHSRNSIESYGRGVEFIALIIIQLYAILNPAKQGLLLQVLAYGIACCLSPYILWQFYHDYWGENYYIYWRLGGKLYYKMVNVTYINDLTYFTFVAFAFFSFAIKLTYLCIFMTRVHEDVDNILEKKGFFATITLPSTLETTNDVNKSGSEQFLVNISDQEPDLIPTV